MGIQNIKELLAFLFSFTDGVVKSVADGKFNILTDAPNFFEAAKVAIPAVKDIGLVPAEYADLDGAEKQELIDYVKEEFDIPNDKVEAFLEGAFAVALSVGDLIVLGKEIF